VPIADAGGDRARGCPGSAADFEHPDAGAQRQRVYDLCQTRRQFFPHL
jgi:hypothetical protein